MVLNKSGIIADPGHSDEEGRFIMLGMSTALRMLVVRHCYGGEDETIRIISARQANNREVKNIVKGYVDA